MSRLPLFIVGGTLARFCGVNIYGSSRDKLWHRVLVQPAYRLLVEINPIYRRFLWRYHPRFNKRHLIDTGLPPGPHANSRLIMHGLFSVLVQHINEVEGGVEALRRSTEQLRSGGDLNAPDGWKERQASDQKEMLALYQWWTEERPKLVADRKQRADEIYGNEPLFTFEDLPVSQRRKVTLRRIPTKQRRSLRGLEQALNQQDDQMLTRLILLRKALD